MILSSELEHSNIIEVEFPLNEAILTYLQNEDWSALDQYFLNAEKPGGSLFKFLSTYLEFTNIEHIIAIRSAPDDEDGIWHDDGSRILGFSLSLTKKHLETQGGELRFRQKGANSWQALTTRPLGRMIIFKTGIYGFEHMVSSVTSGRRIVIAGWCS